MLRTYKAVLRDNRLEWSGEAPEPIPPERPLAVHVTILEEPLGPTASRSQGQEMAAVLERLAETQALSEIDDPVAWEREMRLERPLLGREA